MEMYYLYETTYFPDFSYLNEIRMQKFMHQYICIIFKSKFLDSYPSQIHKISTFTFIRIIILKLMAAFTETLATIIYFMYIIK